MRSRRDFLTTLAWTTGGLLLSNACHGMPGTQTVPAPDWGQSAADPEIALTRVTFPSGSDTVPAFFSRPKARGRHPAVIVLHANWLVEPYIPDTTALLARAGFVGLAIDLFHMFPPVASWEEAEQVPGRVMQDALDKEFTEPRMIRNISSGIDYLRRQPFVADGGVAILGFCGGGWNALLAGAQLADIAAVIAFYAPLTISDPQHRAPQDLVEYMQMPILFHQALKDPFVKPADVDRFEAMVRKDGTPFTRYQYDAFHGFFAFNRVPEFNAKDATLAWQRTVPFLRRYAGAPLKHRALAPSRDALGMAADRSEHTVLHAGHT